MNKILLVVFLTTVNIGCSGSDDTADTSIVEVKKNTQEPQITKVEYDQQTTKIDSKLLDRKLAVYGKFDWEADRFADIRVLRYQVPGFRELPLQQKEMLYYLSQAALSGRDILWDQNFNQNLVIRRTLEEIVKFYEGNRRSDLYKQFLNYTKQVWFANGIHHHYSNEKFTPKFTREQFKTLVMKSRSAEFPLEQGQTIEQFLASIDDALFNPEFAAKKVNRSQGIDKIKHSAVNFYRGVTEKEVVAFYAKKANSNDKTPIAYGLNSQLVKQDGKIFERTWKLGGMYSSAIEKIIFWLEKALTVSGNDKQRESLQRLITFYSTGDLKDFDDFNIAWVNDSESDIDVINGFIEVYNDPLGFKGSFESVVSISDPEATKKIAAIAKNAQWFEDNMPMDEVFKKKQVKGIVGKSIIVVMESGDASPSTPIGINLPNSSWVRAEHGSKSVSLGNIIFAYDQVKGKALEEFAWNDEEILRAKKYASLASELTTDMHEVIGHASGKINSGVGTTKETIKQYASTLEEARADLVGLYYIMDKKLIEIGVSPSLDVGKAAYDRYIRNGMLQQLFRIKPMDNIEESHMRNRQLVASWTYQQGLADKVIEKKKRDGRSYFVINDYQKLRVLFGELLGEIQRIKSEGDYAAAESLVETFGVKVDQALHKEVLRRYRGLDVVPYSGFVNPILVAIKKDDKIIDVKIKYAKSFADQMLNYAKYYSFLPNKN